MRITSLELENIKSYRQAHLDFTPGLNAVCGLNGSGKTTVLEAIGFALFGYLPYSQAAFLREGEKTGMVRVRLLARDDREYEVVRKIGGGSPYYVADVETGTRLAERGENVLHWIAAHALGIDGESDLPALFKDAVGVPQGLMTADFLGTGAQRKSVFDPLLRVEEYRSAFEALRDTAGYLRERVGQVREAIAALEGKTEQIPAKRDEETELREQLQQSEARILDLTQALIEADQRRAALDVREATVARLALELGQSEGKVREHAAALAEQDKALAAAQEARRIVRAAEPGYQKVLAARERLAALEQQRKERDALLEEKAEVNKLLQGIRGWLESLDKQHREAVAAGAKAGTLVDLVTQQDELERRLHDERLRLRDAAGLDAQARQLAQDIADLERTLGAREKRLAGARAAQEEAEQLRGAQERLQAVGEELAALAPLRRQLADVKQAGHDWRRQFDALQAETQRHEALVVQLAALEPLAGELEGLAAEHQARREERVQVVATIEYQQVARAELGRGHCPLLDLRCPVVAADAAATDGRRFDERIATLDARRAELEGQIAALTRRMTAAREAATELQSVRIEVAQLVGSPLRQKEIERELARCREQYAVLAKTVEAETDLQRAQAELQERVNKLHAADKLAAQAGVLEEQQAQDHQRLETTRAEQARVGELRAALTQVEGEVRVLEGQLTALQNPRGRQQDLLALARRQPELEQQVKDEETRLGRETDRLKAILAKLQPFATLDAESDAQHRLVAEHGAEHDRYLAHRDEAGQRDARQAVVATTRRALSDAESAVAGLRRQVEAERAGYDQAGHAALKGRCQELGERISAENAGNALVAKQLERVEEELAYLRRQEEKLAAAGAELVELERVGTAVAFIRETIKAAGPAITETLLTNISQTANDIYAEIMDDHAIELRWNRDYDVLVQRGPETRSFSVLSGGEQMSAALSVRLALLKEMSEIDFAFFDEPTQNMDADRRSNLADQIRAVRGFEQLLVISHDDTFEHHTDNLVRLRKVHEETEVEAG